MFYLYKKTGMMTDSQEYIMPDGASVGHVHLKVTNLQRAIDFYCGILGFQLMQKMGDQAAFVSAGGYHHHIGLNTWYSKGGTPAPQRSAGLFHTAIKVPARKDLATLYKRLREWPYPLTGMADHGVSEALYLDDPDKNGVELYWDRPRDEWPYGADGNLEMYTRPLDIESLLKELKK